MKNKYSIALSVNTITVLALLLCFSASLRLSAQFTFDGPGAAVFNREVTSQPAPGPLGHWNFDVGTGTNIVDLTGNGNAGALTTTNYQWVSPGRNGTGAAVDFAGGYMLTAINSTELSTGFSISFWFKNGRTDTTSQTLAGKTVTAGAFSLSYVFGNRLNFTKDGTSDLTARTSTAFGNLTNTAWTHIVLTWDGTTATQVKFYKNASLIAHDTNVDGSGLIAGTGVLYFGTCVGWIDDVYYYNRPISQAEVTALFAEP